ncbi:MAG: ribonuclease H-like domain-containing protein [Lentinula lateritia]|nr:MAG: ribonuclease H-like domain-containing protein [Lentinula lateritia]
MQQDNSSKRRYETFPDRENASIVANEAKRQKLAPHGSFADALQTMKAMNRDKVARPSVAIDLGKTLVFQQLDIQDCRDPKFLSSVFLFGITEAGGTICLHIVDIPQGQKIEEEWYGMRWISLSPRVYDLVKAADRLSACQYELRLTYENFKCSAKEEPINCAREAPLRILSFDIETDVHIDSSGKDEFPTPNAQSIIQISGMLKYKRDSEPFYRNVLTLKSCNAIEGTDVESFEEESDLIKRWLKFIHDADPDVIVGYNSCGFDIPYILLRAKRLSIPCGISRINDFEISNPIFRPGPGAFSSAPVIPGRLQIDLYDFVFLEHGHPSAKEKAELWAVGIRRKLLGLEASSFRFLKQRKEDIDFRNIPKLQAGTGEDRKKLAIYCLKDSHLPLQLMDHLQALDKWINRAQRKKGTFYHTIRRLAGRIPV